MVAMMAFNCYQVKMNKYHFSEYSGGEALILFSSFSGLYSKS